MDQEDFRRLVAEGKSSSSAFATGKRSIFHKASRDGTYDRRTGKRSSTSEFAPRGLKASSNPAKKVKDETSTDQAPRKTRSVLPEGYTDRVKQRSVQQTEAAEEQEEFRALKDQLARKEISRTQYLQAAQELGGDVQSAGQVRGLDYKLLSRVRAGEDVFEEAVTAEQEKQAEEALEDALADKFQAHIASPPEAHSDGQPVQQEPAEPKKTRASILATLKKPIKQELSKPPQNVTRNRDGGTTETLIKDGRKIKIIRDAQGTVVRRLAKKLKADVPQSHAVSSGTPDATRGTPNGDIEPDAVNRPESSAPPSDGDEDIFEGVGEFSFDDLNVDTQSPAPRKGASDEDDTVSAAQTGTRNYFQPSGASGQTKVQEDLKTKASSGLGTVRIRSLPSAVLPTTDASPSETGSGVDTLAIASILRDANLDLDLEGKTASRKRDKHKHKSKDGDYVHDNHDEDGTRHSLVSTTAASSSISSSLHPRRESAGLGLGFGLVAGRDAYAADLRDGLQEDDEDDDDDDDV